MELAFRSAFDNLPQVLLGALGAGVAIQAIRGIFTDYGRTAGGGFLGGFQGALGAIRGVGGTAPGFGTVTQGFFTGLLGFGANDIEDRIRAGVSRATAVTQTEIQRMRNTLGSVGRDLAGGGFDASPQATTLPERSGAESAMDVAIAYCQGTPLRNEIEARDAHRLGEVTGVAAAAIAARFGTGRVDGKMQGHVVMIER